jgi:hypothetical protein
MDYQLEKKYILDLWTQKPKVATVIVRSKHPDLYEHINREQFGNSFSEKVWRWLYGDPQPCGHCQSATKFLDFRQGYARFCSSKCVANSSIVNEKKKHTNKQRYGVEHFSSTEQYKQKFQQTCLDRYGVSNPGQITNLVQQRSRKKQLTFFNQLLKIISEFSIPNFDFDDYTNVRDKELSWTCVGCGSIFTSSIFGKIPKCQNCYPTGNFGGQSSIEKDLLSEIRKFYSGEIIENSRDIISPKEIDIYFPKEKLAIEVNGIYWHNDSKLDPLYHQRKFHLYNDLGIRLLMITDYEWAKNRELICRMIKHRLEITKERIHTRHCDVRQIHHDLAKSFLETNHIHGHSKASVCYGLYSNDLLLAVITCIDGSRFNKKNSNIEIVRLAFGDYHVPGALGKFIKAVKKDFPNSQITTYADLRYGNGNVYNNNGFVETHTTKPGYWYFLNGTMYHRLSWTKKKLVKMGYSADKTEMEIMQELGALRIYDCGHKHFILKVQNV